MNIQLKVNQEISTEQFITVLNGSSLGERRPVNDSECIKGMLENSNLTISAWDGEKLVGVARCITDFDYACYLSDLAVIKSHQSLGLGKKLQVCVQEQLGPRCKLILIAAPAANEYYEKIGFTNNPRCWVLERESSIAS
ncbi:GNAT family N-acetyltransferase [Alteromonas sp. P256]|uniref:GNAT family N-acetyltransferase n=1 Tax=Alteromonas sp. P256 TaxID=3117399 RepID=UPI002FE30DF5